MKNRIISAAVLLITLLVAVPVQANPKTLDTWFGEAYQVRCTYYTGVEEGEWVGSKGNKLREGVCAAWEGYYGKTLILWAEHEGAPEVIGYYEVLDTGAKWWARPIDETGCRIDFWFETEEEGKEFISEYGEYLYVTVIDSVG